MRAINAAGQALLDRAIAGEKIPFIPMLYLGLAVPQRYALCTVPLVWDGHTWSPREAGIDGVQDDAQQPSGMRVTLPAVTDAERALAVTDQEGAAVTLHLALVDPTTASVGDALELWAGEVDIIGWQAGRLSTMQISAEHRATIALRQRPIRYTNADQQRLYPGDTSLDVDPATDSRGIVWPAASFFRV